MITITEAILDLIDELGENSKKGGIDKWNEALKENGPIFNLGNA